MVMSPRQARFKWPQRQPKPMKKMPDGNPYPYEQAEMADGGVTEPIVSEGVRSELKYNPKPLSNEGDKGGGGHNPCPGK